MPFQIREIATNGHRLAEIIALHKANRRVLGFLPDEGFLDRARQGTLLGYVEDGATRGYVLYDLPGDRVKIVHLCVDASSRKGGIARALIEHLDHLHPDRRCLQLACRRDFPADKLWPKLGFRPVAERTGRSHAGHVLTIWQLAHDHDDLFRSLDEQREIVALDCNVFKDLTSDRRQGSQSRRLRDDWIAELVELCVTEELSHEIHRCEDRELRQQMLAAASSFRALVSAKRDWGPLAGAVETLAPAAEPADHRQVGRAVAGKASYFATRDGKLLDAASAIQQRLGIMVARPEDLILHLDRARYAGEYAPESLHGTSVRKIDVEQVSQNDLVAAFLNYAAGEHAAELHEILRPALADPKAHEFLLLQTVDGELAGMLIVQQGEQTIDVKLIRVAIPGKLGGAIARQLAFIPRQTAAERRMQTVTVSDPTPSNALSAALSAESYTFGKIGWRCEVRRGILDVDADSVQSKDPARQRIESAELERRRWPQKTRGAGIPTFMIPIHPTWAEQLFETNLAAATLFGREPQLGLSREHVYYRSPGWSGGICAPSRILWYVKGGRHGRGYLSALSTLIGVTVGRPRSLHQRFSRLGVWGAKEVARAAGTNKTVMALRFVDTELFAHQQDLDDLRALFASVSLTFRPPQSPQRIDEHMFCLIYERASAYGG